MANVLKRLSSVSFLLSRNVTVRLCANKHSKVVVKGRGKNDLKPGQHVKFEPTRVSIASKGFLRSLKPYDPPANVSGILSSIFAKFGVSEDPETSIIEDAAVRFSLLNDCHSEFHHGVPNSILHTIETVGDLLDFYNTPINVTVPLDRMKSIELPKNLHIQYEYHRFHPETDTMFGGVSAFPKSSTIVTGLKYRKKYKGYTAKTSWL